MMPWRACVRLTSLVFLILLLGCDNEGYLDMQRSSTLERIRQEDIVRLGYANEAPYAYLDRQSGRLTGEAPEIARVILEQMGVARIEGVLTEWGALIPGLKAGRFDIIAAGMYITPKRCREIAFTNPTYRIGEAFIVEAGNPKQLHGYADVAANPKARLGVVAGTVELGYAEDLGVPRERIAVLPDNTSALAALSAGRIDAFGCTRLTASDLLAKAGEASALELAQPFDQPLIEHRQAVSYGAFGVRHGDRALLAELNRRLEAFVGSPEHLQLVAPFGFTAAEMPDREVTAAALCRPHALEAPASD
ncbi:MAG: ectoine/hydroxyectoine ABC transporter substrate-binding protein EhuB [Chromatiales bacterium]|jgi:polar amino acid transport system substrate-binding protein